MSTCEQCGTTFETPSGPVEVTSTRVLCPACAAARRAEKARAASLQKAGRAQDANTAAPASSARPVRTNAAAQQVPAQMTPAPRTSVPATPAVSRPVAQPTPVPARKPVANAASGPVPAAVPPPRVSAPPPRAPAANSAAPAKATPARPAAAKEAPPKAPPPRPSAKAAPAARERAPRDRDDEERSGDVERGAKLLRKKESKATTLGWVVALVLTGVAGAAVYYVRDKQHKEKAVQDAHRAEVKAFWDQLQAFDITTDEGAQQAILLADAKSTLWHGEEIEGDVTGKRAKAAQYLEISAERKSLRERLTAIEQELQDLESLSAEELADQRRKIEELEPAAKVELVGAEYVSKLGVLRTNASKVYAQKLFDEARTAGRENPGREALAVYSRAEEEIQKLYDKSYKEDQENKPYYEQIYRDVMKSSDALVAQVFTPEVIDKAPEIDLLAGEWAGKWQRAEVKGFENRIENGVLHITGPDEDTNAKGVLAIGRGEKWRDFVIDIEYTLESGSAELFFRMRDKPDGSTESFVISTEGQGAVIAGEKYKAQISILGGQNVYRELESLDSAPDVSEISWTKSRWGALCLVIPPGTKLKIERLRIRILR
jgi:hypothetical protein